MDNNETCNILSTRITLLRKLANESQQDLADSIGVKRETVKFWESGDRQIKGADIVKIAKHFDVSADYLLGLCNVKTANPDLQTICKYTGLQEDAVEQLHRIPKIGEVLSGIIVNDGFTFAISFEEIGKAVLTAQLTHEKLGPLLKGDPEAMVTYFGQYKDLIQSIELALFRFSEICRSLPDMFRANEIIKELNSFIWTVLYEGNNGEHQEN